MRASVDSIDSTVRPFTFSFARSSSSAVDRLVAKLAQLVADHLASPRPRGRGGCRRRGRSDPSRRTGWRTSRPSTPARASRAPPGTAATSVEPPRIGVEHAQREAALVAARDARRAEAEVVLLGLLLEKQPRGGWSGARRPRRRLGRRRPPLRQALRTISTSLSCSMLPAAATTRLRGRVALVVVARRCPGPARRPITSAVPMIGRPSGWSPKTASASTSCTLSDGSSSYIAISSITTWRSESMSG